MSVFVICTCVWACVATLAAAWTVGRISDNRRHAAVENAKTLAIEARVAADRSE